MLVNVYFRRNQRTVTCRKRNKQIPQGATEVERVLSCFFAVDGFAGYHLQLGLGKHCPIINISGFGLLKGWKILFCRAATADRHRFRRIFKQRNGLVFGCFADREACFRYKKRGSETSSFVNGCGGRIWTYDLQVMSLTSYRAAPPRDK